jgi:UDP-3-O-[3-hydroxymyristoyl] glucosamine N-acyltransferase
VFHLIGAGDYGFQLYEFIKKNNLIKKIKFVDDKLKFNIKKLLKNEEKIYFNITVGNTSIREKIFLKFNRKNFIYKSIIFPNKNIYTNNIGIGCVLEPNILIANNVVIGAGNFIFYGSCIAHNVTIGNFSNIGCNVVVSGNTKIKDRVHIGANSFISNNLKICSDVFIAPGSTIFKDINKPGIYKDNTFIQKI